MTIDIFVVGLAALTVIAILILALTGVKKEDRQSRQPERSDADIVRGDAG